MSDEKTTTIGEDQPTDESKAMLDGLVSDVVESPPEEQPKEKVGEGEELEAPDTGLEEETETAGDNEEDEPTVEVKEEETSDNIEEDVIPASKVKKIQDKMQKRIDELSRKLNERDQATQKKGASQEDRLESLNTQQLNELRENVDESILDLKVSAKVDGVDITEKLTEYRELKRNIDNTLKSGPARFQQRQIENLQAVIEDVKEIDPDVVSRKGKLWNTAQTIFNRMPSLARTETGMAEAMAMAAEHVLSNNNVSSGREKTKVLNQTVTKLKQKTSLDSKNKSVSSQGESFKKLKAKAVNGTLDDKVEFVASAFVEDLLSH